jgi:TM2 domain-containing membrane protein YozV
MPEIVYPQEEGEPIIVNLREPGVAAFLAWLWPGAGHFYQRRYLKGCLFMICVLSTYFIGLGLGHGRVVYASLKKNDFRWQYGFQMGVGIPALPALAQAMKVKGGADPFFVLCERFPADYHIQDKAFRRITEQNNPSNYGSQPEHKTLKDGFMAPPAGPIFQDTTDTLGRWHYDYKHFFEIGTVYTVIAGLLNFLAIYDAFCGPAIMTPIQRERLESKKTKF